MKTLFAILSAILLAVSFSAHAKNSDSQFILEKIFDNPSSVQQMPFSTPELGKTYSSQYLTLTWLEKLWFLNQLGFADLNSDKCINHQEYGLFLISQFQSLHHVSNRRKQQIRAMLDPDRIELLYSGDRSDLNLFISEVLASDASVEQLYAFMTTIKKAKQWAGNDRTFSSEELFAFKQTWQQFLTIENESLEKFFAAAHSPTKTCHELPDPSIGAEVTNPLAVAIEAGNFVQAKLSTLQGTTVWDGKPGAAIFFAGLFHQTQDIKWKTAADQLFQEIEVEFFSTPHIERDQYSMIEGSSGLGQFALYVYRLLGEQKYLDMAIRYGQFTKLNSFYDHAYGSAGIGIFKLNLFTVTREPRWLAEAELAADHIISGTHTDGRGSYWTFGERNPSIFSGFGHGSAGIGYFFANLYQVTQKKIYLDYAKLAAIHVIDSAHIDSSGGYHWTAYTPGINAGAAFQYQWSHGNFGITYFFNALHEVTHDNLWLVHLENTLKPAIEIGIKFKYDRGDFCCGKSSQGDVYLNMYEKTSDVRYLNLARNAARYLVDANGKVKTSAMRTPLEYPISYSGFSSIGLYFLRLNQSNLSDLPMMVYK